MIITNSIAGGLSIHENGVSIELKEDDAQKILANALKCLPDEACGLLGGAEKNDTIVIKEVYFLKNTDESREHFTMNPKEQLAAVKDMRSKGLKLIGNWHSHPESLSCPSYEDIKLAHDSNIVYFILSLMNEKSYVLNAFSIKNHKEVSAYNIKLY